MDYNILQSNETSDLITESMNDNLSLWLAYVSPVYIRNSLSIANHVASDERAILRWWPCDHNWVGQCPSTYWRWWTWSLIL